MTSKQIFAFFTAFVALPVISVATDHIVGGDRGWTLDFDYKAWADGQVFVVGDKLVFNYLKGDHNVYKTDEAGFQNCVPQAGAEALATGNDVVVLATPGKKWYICGIPGHCSVARQKLSITVLPLSSASASPPLTAVESSSATRMVLPGFGLVLAGVIAMIFVV